MVTAARDAFLTKRVGDVLLLDGDGGPMQRGAGVTSFDDLYAWAAARFPISPLAATLLGSRPDRWANGEVRPVPDASLA